MADTLGMSIGYIAGAAFTRRPRRAATERDGTAPSG
jgi:hypothetical protein